MEQNLHPTERFMDFEGEDPARTMKWFWKKVHEEEDLWDDAKMVDVITYLLGNRHLRI